MSIPLAKFVATHAARTREGFLIGLREPYLLLRHELRGNRDDPSTDQTSSIKGPGAPAKPESALLFPVKKRPGSDAVASALVTLGRAPTNDIVLGDYRISRVQVFFDQEGPSWRVGDAGSTNGTKLDGRPVPRDGGRAKITARQKLLLAGAIELEFLDPEALYDLMVRESMRGDARNHFAAADDET